MKLFATLASATALAIAMPALADPGGNKGGGNKGGGDHSAHAQAPEKRGGNDRGNGGGNGGQRVERGGGNAATGNNGNGGNRGGDARGPEKRAVAAFERGNGGGNDNRGKDRAENPGKGGGNDRGRAVGNGPGRIDRAAPALVRGGKAPKDWGDWRQRERDSFVRVRDLRDIPVVDRRFDRRIVDGRGMIAGCPPGLAKKYNGCMPPGQAKERGYDWLDWRYRDLYRSDYHYDDGYFYRLSGGRIVDYIPLLGGALYVGNSYPVDYFDYPMPAYYGAYYGDDDDYLYRYADGGIYAIDPDTQMIAAIVGLVTGNDWTVGQAMPMGYDVYNVPPAYRDRYYDSDDSWYRYDDGYVYQVDPTTQLIVAAISLLS